MVGLVVGASTLTGIVLKLPAGAWSDVLGRRPLLVAGACVFAVMPFSYLAVGSLGALVLVRFVHGSATAIFGPVASASLSDLAPEGRRATWLSSYSTIQGAGQALGPLVAGYAIAGGRYDLALLAAGLLAFATPFMAAAWPSPASRPAAAPRTPRFKQFTQGILDVAARPLIVMTSVAQAAQFVLNGTLNAFLPLFARSVLGLGPSELGWLFALQTATTLSTRPLMGVLSDRVGRRGVIVTGLLVCSLAVGVAVTTAATSAFITDLSRRARYGAAHGVFGTIYDIGDALGPIVAGLLVAAVGYARMFQIMAGVAMAVTVAFAVVSRHAIASAPSTEGDEP
jgi:MFS family permease